MAFDFETFGQTSNTVAKRNDGFNFESFGVTPEVKVEPKKNIGQKVAGFLGVEKFGQGVGQTIANKEGVQDKLLAIQNQNNLITNQLVDKIKSNKSLGKDTSRLEKALNLQLKANSDFINEINDIGTGGLTNKEVIGSAVSLGTLFVPGAKGGGKTIAQKLINSPVVRGATIGYAMDIANDLQKNKSTKDVLTPGFGTATGGLLPILTSVIGKGVKLEQVSQRLTPTEKKNLGERGKEVAQYLLDNNVVGTPERRLAKVNVLYDDMESRVKDVVDSSKVSYSKNEIVNALQDIKGAFLSKPAEYQSVSNKIDEVSQFLYNYAEDSIPAPIINEYKRSLASSAYNEKGNKVLSDGLKAASDVMYSFLQDTIPGLKPLNSEYSKIILAKDLLTTASTRAQAGLFEKGAGFALGGAIGTAIGGGNPLVGAGAGTFLGPKVVEKTITPIRTGTAIALDKINKLVNKIPTDKVGNLQISKKALIQLLSK